MHRDLIREAEIIEEATPSGAYPLPHLRGEMACVADPDDIFESYEDDIPDTLPEPLTQPSPSQLEREVGVGGVTIKFHR